MAGIETPKRAMIEHDISFEEDRAVVLVYVRDSKSPGHQDYTLRILLKERDDDPEVFSEDRFNDMLVAGMKAISWIRQDRDNWAESKIKELANRPQG